MKKTKKIIIPLLALIVIVAAGYAFWGHDTVEEGQQTTDQSDDSMIEEALAAVDEPAPPSRAEQAMTEAPTRPRQMVSKGLAVVSSLPEEMDFIDPVLHAEAENELTLNEIYEDVARETLPTLSIQTHNPIWALEQTTQEPGQEGPLPAPEAGEFGKLQPPEGEIWLRIPPEHASEHRDIMAQNADLYRLETGYEGSISVLLWVGGRPYAKHTYE